MNEPKSNNRSTPIIVEPGNPNNWPRKIARKYKSLNDAIEVLETNMDELNQRFALREFIAERVRRSKNGNR